MRSIKRIKNNILNLSSKLFRRLHQHFSGSCAILLYHRVTDLDFDPQLLSVGPANFYEQIKYLNNTCNILPVEEFIGIMQSSKKFPPRSVLLTFDDGYADNFIQALPILEYFKAQSIFYITTGNIDSGHEFWWDAVERIFLLNDSRSLPESFTLFDKLYKTDSAGQLYKTYEALLPVLRRLPATIRNKYINQFAADFNSAYTRVTHRPLTWSEVKAFSESSSVVIGAHTSNHPSLGALNFTEQKGEIENSITSLKSRLKINVHHFSYPFGSKVDYNADTLKIIKQSEVQMACANYPGLIISTSDQFALPRFLVRDWSIDIFKENINSFFR
jgi:peptidoglycan/xylan/chitin deacetylase (PgdA/CDA1 family)